LKEKIHNNSFYIQKVASEIDAEILKSFSASIIDAT